MIRPATADDAPGIAAVQVRTWHTAYRGLVPDSYLAKVNLDDAKIARWRKWVEDGPIHLFVAIVDGAVAGFAGGGPQRDPDLPFSGELYAIYILAEHQKAGLGRALVREVVGDLAKRSMTSLSVWVFERGPGRGFYERLGGRLLDKRIERDFDGELLTEISFGWPDTAVLR